MQAESPPRSAGALPPDTYDILWRHARAASLVGGYLSHLPVSGYKSLYKYPEIDVSISIPLPSAAARASFNKLSWWLDLNTPPARRSLRYHSYAHDFDLKKISLHSQIHLPTLHSREQIKQVESLPPFFKDSLRPHFAAQDISALEQWLADPGILRRCLAPYLLHPEKEIRIFGSQVLANSIMINCPSPKTSSPTSP